METKMIKIDKYFEEMILDIQKKNNFKTQKEVVENCINICYKNSVIFEDNKIIDNSYLLKIIKEMELKIFKELNILPIKFKKITDADDEFHPFFENFKYIISKYEEFLNKKNLNIEFSNSLNDIEKEYFNLSQELISNY